MRLPILRPARCGAFVIGVMSLLVIPAADVHAVDPAQAPGPQFAIEASATGDTARESGTAGFFRRLLPGGRTADDKPSGQVQPTGMKPSAELPPPGGAEPVTGVPLANPADASVPGFNLEMAPIDLPSALRLAGVENPQIQIAGQRVIQALADRQLAAAQILPTFNIGGNYDTHSGNVQQSDGNILNVSRSSLYLGAGANAVGTGTVTIPGFVWSLNVSNSIYTFLVSQQNVEAQRFASIAVRNQMLLDVAVAYTELLRAEGSLVIAIRVREDAREVARLTTAYAETGEGRQADANRASSELRRRETDVLEAEGNLISASARLAQLLNLNPAIRLHPNEPAVIPLALVPDPIPLKELIAIAMLKRPELLEQQAAIRAALLALGGAKMLPFSPNVIVGLSGGVFGGGSNLVANRFGSFGGRADADVVGYWSLQNLGVGNAAMINAAASRARQADWRKLQVLDQVRTEVAEAFARTHARFAQIGVAEQAVRAGQAAFEEDLIRIRAREGLPIEVLDSLRLWARARQEYLTAIVDYDVAQFQMYVALGQPPADMLARPVPADPDQVPPDPSGKSPSGETPPSQPTPFPPGQTPPSGM
ncbi:MAG TPA: TolC family protein [Pirellulales bacterium]|nr:TolC family protein [Pirellulales bacterium]